MKDLLKAFFERDLNQAEEKALAVLLKQSPSEAERFSKLAASEYGRTGLPAPRLHAGRGRWKAFVLGMATMAGICLLAWWGMAPVTGSLLIVPSEDRADTGFKLEQTPAGLTPVMTAPAQPAALPAMKVSLKPSHLGLGFQVALKIYQEQDVRLEVLDRQGRQVRNLFHGPLKPGDWTLQWDGRDSNNRLATAGRYKIQMQAGNTIRSKYVELTREGG